MDFRHNPSPFSQPQHQCLYCFHCRVTRVSMPHHIQEPEVGEEHSHDCQESTAEDVLPAAVKEILNLPHAMMIQFYAAIIKSILTLPITIWSFISQKQAKLQHKVRTAKQIISSALPSLQDTYNSRVIKCTGKIIADPFYLGRNYFQPLPSAKRLKTMKVCLTRRGNSFSPRAVALMY